MSKVRLVSAFLLGNLVIAFVLCLPSTPVGTLARADEAMSVRGAACWKPNYGTRWLCCWGHAIYSDGIEMVSNVSDAGGFLKTQVFACTCSGSYTSMGTDDCLGH